MAKHVDIAEHYAEASRELEAGRRAAIGAVLDVSWEAIKTAAGLSRTTGESVSRVASRVGAQAFAREWKWARLSFPLQARLAAEQGLWDLGGDYRRLISGFRPLTVPRGARAPGRLGTRVATAAERRAGVDRPVYAGKTRSELSSIKRLRRRASRRKNPNRTGGL